MDLEAGCLVVVESATEQIDNDSDTGGIQNDAEVDVRFGGIIRL